MARFEKGYSVSSNPYPELICDPHVLFAGVSQTLPGHVVGPKVLDYYLLHHVVSGRGVYRCGGQEFQLQAGDSFLIEPEQLVSYTADQEYPWHYHWVAFQGDKSAKLLSRIGFSSAQPIAQDMNDRELYKLYQQIQTTFYNKNPFSPLEAAGNLLLLLSIYGEMLGTNVHNETALPETQAASTVRQAIHYLSTQYAEEITMETMAESLGYNRAYLSRLFKNHTGETPVTFLLKLRIDQARRLLREREDLTVEQIAFSVGFHDPLYFSKQFRRLQGLSPSQYRIQ
jgi:AraC-like DNA-binding protein